MRFFLQLSYLGTNFHGWQRQPNAHSVQQEIETALSKLLREDIKITGAGRTDTGVHAKYYVAHFDTLNTKALSVDFVYHLNAILCKDVSVSSLRQVTAEASARFSALDREYKYFISTHKDPFTQQLAHYVSFDLDIKAMNEAASKIMTYSDFTSFAKLHTDTLNNICKVTEAYFTQEGNTIIFTIRANRFLRNMVRAIVGTLIDVGRGKLSVQQFCDIIELEDRCKAGSSASPSGLYLTDVCYPNEIYL